MSLNPLQTKIVNNYLNLLVLEIANNYLNKLKKFKAKEVNEIILKFLDNSVFLAEEKIDITNNYLNSHIIKMTEKEKKQFNKSLNKKNSYSNMCNMLNFIYVIIKEKDKQELLFKKLYEWYDKSEDDLIQREYEKLNIYQEIKPWLLNSNTLYNQTISRI